MQFIVATHNAKKLIELNRILEPLGIAAVTDSELGIALPEVEETGETFEDNALLKAESACKHSGLPAVADDSGLMVDALNGAPGVYSARYAGEGATDEQRNSKLLNELQDVPEEKRTAQFVSAVCCVFPNGDRLIARGTCPGRIGYEPQGNGGFGYDPVFIVSEGLAGAGKTYAELTAEEKDQISHRGNALRLLSRQLEDYMHTNHL